MTAITTNIKLNVHQRINARDYGHKNLHGSRKGFDLYKTSIALIENYSALGFNPFTEKRHFVYPIYWVKVSKDLAPKPCHSLHEALDYCHYWNGELLNTKFQSI